MEITSIAELERYEQSKCGNQKLLENQLIQAKAEVALAKYYYNLQNRIDIEISINTDMKVNPSSKKDVDIQICKDDLALNIEVKTPEQDVIEEGKFHGGIAHRYPGIVRAEENPDVKKVAEMLKRGSGIETQTLKTNDNKIKDFIYNVNAKFTERNDKSLNTLMITCTSEQWQQAVRSDKRR